MKRKNIVISCFCCVVICVLLYFWNKGAYQNIGNFLSEYFAYVSGDTEHKAALFEKILTGICSGTITFAALFITIKHENNKGKREQKEERRREQEKLLMSVHPILYISIHNISGLRDNKEISGGNIVTVGNGSYYQYIQVTIINQGYGRCLDIVMNADKFSVRQLNVDEEKEVRINFNGFDAKHSCVEYDVDIGYSDIFGNRYLQKFTLHWLNNGNALEIESGESILEKNDE